LPALSSASLRAHCIFPKGARDVRRARLNKFPYVLYFRQMPDGIRILACFHFRRGARALQSRN